MPWSEQTVEWSVDGCLEWLDVEVSALPIFDAKQRLKGFRGFGVLKMQEKVQDEKVVKLDTKTSSLSRE